ncbi:hypothetical protein [Streptomyces globisporus]|uniref:hypothetical protein n=1 Tax=Streptomyces globisporus TaxID=1908 RepID=UPI0011DF6F4B|nr:hypothetical protein [Streptomyces globisporus]
MKYPIQVALARAVPVLPDGSAWHFEIKVDGSPDILECLIGTVWQTVRRSLACCLEVAPALAERWD